MEVSEGDAKSYEHCELVSFPTGEFKGASYSTLINYKDVSTYLGIKEYNKSQRVPDELVEKP